ncbi:Glucan endo-1,3-beta-glucosidase, partial [Linum grandiflorum]
LQILLAPSTAAAYSIGVNYGTHANNLPPPSQVATFLKSHTTIDRVKIFDANPDILRAFADIGISVTVTIANANVPSQAPRRPRLDLNKHPPLPPEYQNHFHTRRKRSPLLEGHELLRSIAGRLCSVSTPAVGSPLAASELQPHRFCSSSGEDKEQEMDNLTPAPANIHVSAADKRI